MTQELRNLIVFAAHNVLQDAPFTGLHLISGRNLLIYLAPAAQKAVLSRFHFGLETGGYLMLGTSETPGPLSDEFDAIDDHWKVYRKRRDATPRAPGYLVARPPATWSAATCMQSIVELHVRAESADDTWPILEVLRSGVPAHSTEEVFLRSSGTTFPVEYWSHPIWRDQRSWERSLHFSIFRSASTTRRKSSSRPSGAKGSWQCSRTSCAIRLPPF